MSLRVKQTPLSSSHTIVEGQVLLVAESHEILQFPSAVINTHTVQ